VITCVANWWPRSFQGVSDVDKYDIADSVHRGDAFEVYDTGAGSVAIVRRVDGEERFLQPEDGEQLVHELDLFGVAFDDNAEYVERADNMLSEFFA